MRHCKERLIPVLVTTALCLSLYLAGCSKSPPATQAVPVRVIQASAIEGTQGLRYAAEVTPYTQVDVAFRSDGYIASIAERPGLGQPRVLQPGDTVVKDEVLARVRDQQYRDSVIEAEANVSKAKAARQKAGLDYQRAQALIKTASITAPEFDAAREEYETAVAGVTGARARLDQANLKLHDTVLRAPMAGLILQRNIEMGSLVHSDSVGFVLADLSRVKVLFSVPDLVLKDLKLGSRLNIRTESLPNRVFHGAVTEIAPAADQRTRVFGITVTVPNPDGALKTGMIAALDVAALRLPAQQVVVPMASLVTAQDNPESFAVFVVKTEQQKIVARRQGVVTGQVLGNRIVISRGLSVGQRVIVTGAAQVRDGQAVAIVP